ncbi:MAG: Mur ligase domain-containing protein [Marinilabiliales bacterium]|nr:Mur ligase domain-containing protein [Marinilabiliales bacterium]
MIDFKNIEGIYFVGIGGIGMSALALYFAKGGFTIAGYDRIGKQDYRFACSRRLCIFLMKMNTELIPALFRESSKRDKVLVVYTPAIPSESRILSLFQE